MRTRKTIESELFKRMYCDPLVKSRMKARKSGDVPAAFISEMQLGECRKMEKRMKSTRPLYSTKQTEFIVDSILKR